MIKSLNVAEQTKLSPFESELVESKQELIRFWFTQEIFDTLVFDTEKQIEKFETETKELKQFLSQLHKGKDSKKNYWFLKNMNVFMISYHVFCMFFEGITAS